MRQKTRTNRLRQYSSTGIMTTVMFGPFSQGVQSILCLFSTWYAGKGGNIETPQAVTSSLLLEATTT